MQQDRAAIHNCDYAITVLLNLIDPVVPFRQLWDALAFHRLNKPRLRFGITDYTLNHVGFPASNRCMRKLTRRTGISRGQRQKKCPKHGVSYALRRNAKTGELALACPLCDVEAHGGTRDDVMLVAKNIADSAKK